MVEGRWCWPREVRGALNQGMAQSQQSCSPSSRQHPAAWHCQAGMLVHLLINQHPSGAAPTFKLLAAALGLSTHSQAALLGVGAPH